MRSLLRQAYRWAFRRASRWLAGPAPSGWLAMRLVLVVGIVTPAVGLGGWVRPASIEHAQVAELGLHAGPSAHGDPADHAPEFPLRSEIKDSKDSEDEFRERTSVAPLWLAPAYDLDLAADSHLHRFADAHDGGPGSSHRGALHNRGPPVV